MLFKNCFRKILLTGRPILGYSNNTADFICVKPVQKFPISVGSVRACTGFDGGFEVWEAIRGLRDRVSTWNLKLNADNNELAYAA